MTTKRTTKQQYILKRRRRARELYLTHGYGVAEIAERLVNEGTITTTSETLDSAIRLIRADVAEFRAEIDARRTEDAGPEVAQNVGDSALRELERLRYSYDKLREIADCEEIVTSTMVTPNGAIVTEKPKWPPGVRQKAAKDCATVAEKISTREAAIIASQGGQAVGSGTREDGTRDAPFQFVFPSGKPLDALIRDRIADLQTN